VYVITLTWDHCYWATTGGWTDWLWQAARYGTEEEARAVAARLRVVDRDCVVIGL
jgi:hypothetical protein